MLSLSAFVYTVLAVLEQTENLSLPSPLKKGASWNLIYLAEKLKKTPDPWHRKQGMIIPHTCLKFFPPRPGLGRFLIRAFAHYLLH